MSHNEQNVKPKVALGARVSINRWGPARDAENHGWIVKYVHPTLPGHYMLENVAGGMTNAHESEMIPASQKVKYRVAILCNGQEIVVFPDAEQVSEEMRPAPGCTRLLHASNRAAQLRIEVIARDA